MLSVGELLRKEREKKGLTLHHIAKEIKIREKFLDAIERNDWKLFSSKVYISGVIKNYAHYLDLDSSKMLAFFRREYERKEDVSFKERVSDKHLTSETKKTVLISLIAVAVFMSAYFGYQLVVYFSPPKVVIVSPQETTFQGQDMIKIIGKIDKEAVITIFGDRIYQDKNGIFEYNLPLQKGKNEVVIEVIGANGKKTTVTKVFFNE